MSIPFLARQSGSFDCAHQIFLDSNPGIKEPLIPSSVPARAMLLLDILTAARPMPCSPDAVPLTDNTNATINLAYTWPNAQCRLGPRGSSACKTPNPMPKRARRPYAAQQ
jgi:hypothetical protein